MRWLLVSMVLACGCSPSTSSRHGDNIPLDKIPPAAMDAAQKAAKERFADLKFESAWKKPSGVFEITGKTKNGKVHDVEVTEAGEITEVE
jgi:hypothetical protein